MLPKSNLSKLKEGTFDDSYTIKKSNWKQSDDNQFQIYWKEEIAEIIDDYALEAFKANGGYVLAVNTETGKVEKINPVRANIAMYPVQELSIAKERLKFSR